MSSRPGVVRSRASRPQPTYLPLLIAARQSLHPRLRVSGMTDDEAGLVPFQLDEQTLRQRPILARNRDEWDQG